MMMIYDIIPRGLCPNTGARRIPFARQELPRRDGTKVILRIAAALLSQNTRRYHTEEDDGKNLYI